MKEVEFKLSAGQTVEWLEKDLFAAYVDGKLIEAYGWAPGGRDVRKGWFKGRKYLGPDAEGLEPVFRVKEPRIRAYGTWDGRRTNREEDC
jgi:hypothetical protein